MNWQFKHQCVSDLAWVMNCPALLSNSISDEWCRHTLAKAASQLNALDHDPLELKTYLAKNQKSPRLGFYFEVLIQFWLEKILRFANVQTHVAVRDQQRTIGEHDFLFFDTEASVQTHWEVAVKFYLYNGPREAEAQVDFHSYWGPAGKDQLHLKVAKIFDHQLKISPLKNAKAFVKGMLFYPFEMHNDQTLPMPSKLNSGHLRGWWSRENLPEQLALDSTSQWLILSKKLWLGNLSQENLNDINFLRAHELKIATRSHFENSKNALMIVQFKNNKEISRGFIAHPSWPLLE